MATPVLEIMNTASYYLTRGNSMSRQGSKSLRQWYINTNFVLCFWTLSIILFLINSMFQETGFHLCVKVEPTQLGLIDRASPNLHLKTTMDNCQKHYSCILLQFICITYY
jgi:hypothetical protein